MKLFLTSINTTGIQKLITGKPKDNRVLFIPTAANVYEDKWFVKNDLESWISQGFQLHEFDIESKPPEEIEEQLEKVDIIHFAGGNSFYLLQHIYSTNLHKLLPKYLINGLIYSGGSAGATIAGSNIEPAGIFDDPAKAPQLKTTKGLGFIDFALLPHYGKAKYEDRYQQVFSQYKNKYKLLTITDNQSIIINHNWHQIINYNQEKPENSIATDTI